MSSLLTAKFENVPASPVLAETQTIVLATRKQDVRAVKSEYFACPHPMAPPKLSFSVRNVFVELDAPVPAATARRTVVRNFRQANLAVAKRQCERCCLSFTSCTFLTVKHCFYDSDISRSL